MKEPISRAFKQDFPQFVDRAKALGVRISLSPGKRNGPRAYWLDGYRQLTGYTTRKDGGRFTEADAARNINTALKDIEEDRRAIEGMTQDERFARVMEQFRQMEPQYRMIGEVRFPGGDRGHVFFMAEYDGEARLEGIGTVAKAKVPWAKDVGQTAQMAAFCDLLERDYERRRSEESQAA